MLANPLEMNLISFRTAAQLITTYLESSKHKRNRMLTHDFREALILVGSTVDEVSKQTKLINDDNDNDNDDDDDDDDDDELTSPWETNTLVSTCPCGLRAGEQDGPEELDF